MTDSTISTITTSPPRNEIGFPAVGFSAQGFPGLEFPPMGFPANGSLLPNVKTPTTAFHGLAAGLMNFRPSPLALPQSSTLTDSVALALMQQFSTMQQQLFDHTQQLLTVMAQTFSNAHNRQLDLIRDELYRVHEVNRELQELNLKLTLSEQDQKPAAASPVAAPAFADPPVAADAGAAGLAGPASLEAIGTIPAAPAPSSDAAPPAEPVQPAGVVRAQGRKFAKKNRNSGPSASPVQPEAAAGQPGPDMHAWLSGRINELEVERTTRWQKIMQILTPNSGPN